MKIPIIASAIFLTMMGAASAQSQSDSSVPTIPATQIEPRKVATPFEFVSVATSADEFEIASSKMALERAASGDVKALAQMLIDDHTKSVHELLQNAKTMKVEIAEPSPDGEQKGLLGKLEAVTGPDFDKIYLEAQVFVHQRAIALFKGYTAANDPLSAFAAKTLPTLEMHYAKAVELAAKLQAGNIVQ